MSNRTISMVLLVLATTCFAVSFMTGSGLIVSTLCLLLAANFYATEVKA